MPDEGEDPSPRTGRIVTFYSFKGGTGRTMALANVAWILAANGKRVLVADWDLESPGLHKFFQPFMTPASSDRPGIVDFIRQYEWAKSRRRDRSRGTSPRARGYRGRTAGHKRADRQSRRSGGTVRDPV